MKKASEKGKGTWGKFGKAFAEAEKQVKDEQVRLLAAEIRKVMDAARDANRRIQAAQDELKVLQADLKDLKAGKIDKIKERQASDPHHYSKINVPAVETLYRMPVNLNSNLVVPVTTSGTLVGSSSQLFDTAMGTIVDDKFDGGLTQ